MAIDDSFDAVDGQYPEPEGEFAKELATVVGGLAFPKADVLFGALGIAIRHFSTKARIDRALAFIHALIDRVLALEKREAISQDRVEELAEAIQIACYRDVESFKTQNVSVT